MENKTKLTIGAIITLLIAISGTYYVAQDDDAYYCESRDMVMICEKLSSGLGTRCYFENTYKVCKEGWKEIVLEQELTGTDQIIEVPVYIQGIKWECSPIKCIRIQ